MNSEQIKVQLTLFCEMYDLKPTDFLIKGEANWTLRGEIFTTDEIELVASKKTIDKMFKEHDTLRRFETFSSPPVKACKSIYFTGLTIEVGTVKDFSTEDGIQLLLTKEEEIQMGMTSW